jgi:hypothetical protein
MPVATIQAFAMLQLRLPAVLLVPCERLFPWSAITLSQMPEILRDEVAVDQVDVGVG